MGGAFGFLLAGPLGALLGAALGHQFDRGIAMMGRYLESHFQPGAPYRVQTAFFTATFSIMGHVAKADGRVSEAEIEFAQSVMDKMELTGEMRKTAIHLFREGKIPQFPLDEALEQFRMECRRRYSLIRLFIEIQVQAAYADGVLHPAEDRLLLHICRQLRFSRFELQALKSMLEARLRFSEAGHGRRKRQPPGRTELTLREAYAVLGVAPPASDVEIKRAYRRMISQHHPDKLLSKGITEEAMKLATEKSQEIQKAYETICKARKK